MQNNMGRNYLEFGRFRFIGHDGSMGYRTGKIYNLQRTALFDEDGSITTRLACGRTGLQRLLHGDGFTPYDSQELFYRNWEEA